MSGSSFRVNLGAGFAPQLFDEAGKIKVLDSCFEMFYKEGEEATYPPQIRRADSVEGSTSAPHAGQVIMMPINALYAGLRQERKVERITEKISRE